MRSAGKSGRAVAGSAARPKKTNRTAAKLSQPRLPQPGVRPTLIAGLQIAHGQTASFELNAPWAEVSPGGQTLRVA